MPRDLSEPLSEVAFLVKADETGARLDTWLQSRVSWRSRSDLQRRIHDGRVLVDGRPARKSTRLREGQEVRVAVDRGPATEEVPVEDIPIDVLYEDQWIIVLDKAPGIVVHPVGRHVMDTYVNALHARHQRGQGIPGDCAPMIAHRLDRDTSGVLVLAKSEHARRELGRDFEERRVEKTYLAVVSGPMRELTGTIDLPIGPDVSAEIRLKVACVDDGKPSRTDWELVRSTDLISLVRCYPRTGRQHQIRVHLAAIGHPVLCDRLYGDPSPITAGVLDPDAAVPDHVLLARQSLHAERLVIKHPITGALMTFTADLPGDMAAVI